MVYNLNLALIKGVPFMLSQTVRRSIGFTATLILVLLLVVGCHQRSNSRNSNQKALLTQMYQYFGELKKNTLKVSDMKRFYTKDAVMILNGHAVAKGYQGFYNHFKKMLGKTRNFKFVFPKDSMIEEGNRIAVQYKVELPGYTEKQLHVMAIFTFKNGKIASWDEVVYPVIYQ